MPLGKTIPYTTKNRVMSQNQQREQIFPGSAIQTKQVTNLMTLINADPLKSSLQTNINTHHQSNAKESFNSILVTKQNPFQRENSNYQNSETRNFNNTHNSIFNKTLKQHFQVNNQGYQTQKPGTATNKITNKTMYQFEKEDSFPSNFRNQTSLPLNYRHQKLRQATAQISGSRDKNRFMGQNTVQYSGDNGFNQQKQRAATSNKIKEDDSLYESVQRKNSPKIFMSNMNQTFTSGFNTFESVNTAVPETLQIEGGQRCSQRQRLNSTCFMDVKNQIIKEARKRDAIQKDQILQLEQELSQVKGELNRVKEIAKKYLNDALDSQSISRTDPATSKFTQDGNYGQDGFEISNKTRQGSSLEVHSLYHDLFLTDLKSDINSAHQELSSMRLDNTSLQVKLSNLKKENQDLKTSIARYRKLMIEQEKKVGDLQKQLEKSQRGAGIFTMKSKKLDKIMSNVLKDDYEDNKIGTPMNKGEEITIRSLSLGQKLEQLSKLSKQLLGCQSLKQLFNQIRSIIKTIFRSESTYILLHTKELCNEYQREKGFTTSIRIENEWYEVVVYDLAKEQEKLNKLKIEFNQKEIQNGVIKGNIICWPVLNNRQKNGQSFGGAHGQQQDKELQLFIQINGYKSFNYKAADATITNIICKMISSVLDQIQSSKRSQLAVQRSFDILDIFKTLLSERNHALLFCHMVNMFPKLFNFKESGVLFMDVKSKHLYSITSDDYERTAIDLNEDNIVRFPNNIGLTGQAIAKKEIIVSHTGFKDRQFAPEVDNYININKINNMLIGAMVDKNGEVKGVLQLINKVGSEGQITDQDLIELRALLPALGEIIRTADESMEITRLSYALKQCLGNINNAVFDKEKDIGQNNLAMLDSMVRAMSNQINALVKHKKEYVFGGDKSLVSEVFMGLKMKLSSQIEGQRELRSGDSALRGIMKSSDYNQL
eukprot:403360366